MSSLREMSDHIRSITGIGHITRTLQAVSASRVKASTRMAEDSQAYKDISFDVLAEMFNCAEILNMERNYYDPHPDIRNALVVFISAEQGLAGSFTLNIFREIVRLEKALKGVNISYITVGKKGRDMLIRRRKNIIADFSDMSLKTIRDKQLKAMRNIILEEYDNGIVDVVYMVYTNYQGISHCVPRTRMLLPLYEVMEQWNDENDTVTVDKYLFEGNPKEMLDTLVRRVTERRMYHAILASRAGENASRMLAMNAANENAVSLANQLKLEYDKVRQQLITNDILEISGGSEALQKAEELMKKKNSILSQED